MSLGPETFDLRPKLAEYVGRKVTVGIRPEDLMHPDEAPELAPGQRIRAKVDHIEALGFEQIGYFDIDAKAVYSEDALDLGADVDLRRSDTARITGPFGPSTSLNVGTVADVVLRTDQAHLFDPDTGLAIRA